jgi:hypothetical protein
LRESCDVDSSVNKLVRILRVVTSTLSNSHTTPLNDLQRALRDARAKIRAELGVTRPTSALFTALYYGFTLLPSKLPMRAVMEDYNPDGPLVTEEECQVALNDCLARGWLQVVSEAARLRIADRLHDGGVLGPIYGGLPEVGCVDFTDAGAELLRQIDERVPKIDEIPFAYTDVVHEKTAHFFRSRTAAITAIEEAQGRDDVVAVAGPFEIGPWRAQWWRKFPEGFRIDVEERRHWQGHSSPSDESCRLYRLLQPIELPRLRRVLASRGVSFQEWVLLAAMECEYDSRSADLCRRAGRYWADEFGAPVSEPECRQALASCLDSGWLRVLNRDVLDEIHLLFRADPCFLALPRLAELRPTGYCYDARQYLLGKRVPVPPQPESRWGEVVFTLPGASLYRQISDEWLGTDWEDDVRASRCYHWEEHYYCEAEAGLEHPALEHLAHGRSIRAKRIVPIGPWCVYWWRQYPVGFRLELELGAS